MKHTRAGAGPADTGTRRGRKTVAVATLLATVGLTGCGAFGADTPAKHGKATRAGDGPAAAPSWDRSPQSLAAVGDSITRGFDACSVLSDCPEVSWATGSDASVRSLAVRLLGSAGARENSWNFARSGARMNELDAQMRQAVARKPELVTVMAGANDACRSSVRAMTSVEDFRRQLTTAMHTLRSSLPETQVYVASVPDLKRLWSQGRTSQLGKQVWKLGICPSMLRDADVLDASAKERRESVQDRVVAYNKVLGEVCAEDKRCRFDGGAVFDYRFGTAQLSPWDWFHPSKDGQSRLAEIAYRTVTAVRPVDTAKG